MTALHTMDEAAAKLRDVLAYNPLTGELAWRVDHGRRIKAGTPIRAINSNGYIIVGFNYKNYLGHRVAWLLATGSWPDGVMDHINGNRSDNRLSNLRICDWTQSNANRSAMRSVKKGVSFHKRNKKWHAKIQAYGVIYRLGTFDTEDEAHACYVRAAQTIFKDFARAE